MGQIELVCSGAPPLLRTMTVPPVLAYTFDWPSTAKSRAPRFVDQASPGAWARASGIGNAQSNARQIKGKCRRLLIIAGECKEETFRPIDLRRKVSETTVFAFLFM